VNDIYTKFVELMARVAIPCPLSPEERERLGINRCRYCIQKGIAERVNCKWFISWKKAMSI